MCSSDLVEVPIYVAAAGALVAKYAGRQGDGFICTSGKKRELYTETLLPKVEEGLAAGGPKAQPYDRMIEVKVSFDSDRQRALDDTRHWAALALTPEESVQLTEALAINAQLICLPRSGRPDEDPAAALPAQKPRQQPPVQKVPGGGGGKVNDPRVLIETINGDKRQVVDATAKR